MTPWERIERWDPPTWLRWTLAPITVPLLLAGVAWWAWRPRR